MPKRREGRRELTLEKRLWWYVTRSLPLSSAALLSEWPMREPFHWDYVSVVLRDSPEGGMVRGRGAFRGSEA